MRERVVRKGEKTIHTADTVVPARLQVVALALNLRVLGLERRHTALERSQRVQLPPLGQRELSCSAAGFLVGVGKHCVGGGFGSVELFVEGVKGAGQLIDQEVVQRLQS